jgi:hypothetical protein
MLETVLILPLVFLLLLLLFYFGRGMVREQHAKVANRYEAWRTVSEAPGAHPAAPDLNDDAPDSGPEWNQVFFGGHAANVHMSHRRVALPLARGAAVSHATSRSVDAGQTLASYFANLPAAMQVDIGVEHPASGNILSRYDRSISHRHIRQHNDWMAANGVRLLERQQPPIAIWLGGGSQARISHLVSNQFYGSFDASMASLQTSSNRYAGMVRGLYRASPGYQGPILP